MQIVLEASCDFVTSVAEAATEATLRRGSSATEATCELSQGRRQVSHSLLTSKLCVFASLRESPSRHYIMCANS